MAIIILLSTISLILAVIAWRLIVGESSFNWFWKTTAKGTAKTGKAVGRNAWKIMGSLALITIVVFSVVNHKDLTADTQHYWYKYKAENYDTFRYFDATRNHANETKTHFQVFSDCVWNVDDWDNVIGEKNGRPVKGRKYYTLNAYGWTDDGRRSGGQKRRYQMKLACETDILKYLDWELKFLTASYAEDFAACLSSDNKDDCLYQLRGQFIGENQRDAIRELMVALPAS